MTPDTFLRLVAVPFGRRTADRTAQRSRLVYAHMYMIAGFSSLNSAPMIYYGSSRRSDLANILSKFSTIFHHHRRLYHFHYFGSRTVFYRIIYRTGSHGIQNRTIVQWKKLCGQEVGIPVVVIKQGQYEDPIDS